jgi:F-type H+-transporting ATPase subunit epsilon
MPARPSFSLKIVSPSSVIVDAQVRSIQAPGIEGDFGVLKGHAPFFSMLRPGVISVQMANEGKRHFFATSGFADVTPDGCTITSEHIQDVNDISPDVAKEALAAAQKDFADADTASEKAAAQKRVVAAQELVHAVTQ